MGSSTTVQAPQPSAEEKVLLQNILDQLTKQQAYNDQMMPEYAHQLHYKIEDVAGTPYQFTGGEQQVIDKYNTLKPQYEAAKAQMERYPSRSEYWSEFKAIESQYLPIASQYNLLQDKAAKYDSKTTQKWVKMSDDEWYNSEQTTDAERRAWDISTETQTRQLKALRGELPLTESLQQQKEKEFAQMKATYGITGNDVNSAVANDTIGTQNLSEFKKRWNALEEQERYGQLQTGMANTVQSTGLATDLANNKIGTLSSLGGANSGVTQGYYSLLQPYMAYTQAGYQAAAANAQANANRQSSLMGMGGMLGAAALMAASSKKYKTDIKTKTKKDEDRALSDVLKTRSVEFRYKKNMGLGTGKRLGAIAEESVKSITNDNRTAINLANKLELVSMAVKALDRKIDKRVRA